MYSLALKMLYARVVSRELRQLKDSLGQSDILRAGKKPISKMIKAARRLLIETPSVPIEVFNGKDRDLAQLVVHPENWPHHHHHPQA